MRSMFRLTSCLAVVALLTAVMGATLAQTTYVWNSTSGGDWDTGSNWTPAGPADGAGNTADLGQQDISGYADVAMVTNRTLGHLILGDTDPIGTPGVWTLYGDDGAGSYADITLTLDTGGAGTPSITVSAFGEPDPGINDAWLDHILLAGTQGFSKEGDGILTLNGSLAGLSGTIDLNGGTLRVQDAADLGVISAITAADGTALDVQFGNDIHAVTLDAGATVTIATEGSANSTLTDIQSAGSATLNLTLASNRNAYIRGTWGTGFDALNLTKSGGGVATWRPNRYWDGWWSTMNSDLELNLTGIAWTVQDMWSGGATVAIGAFNGDVESTFYGSGSGGQMRYQIGGKNVDAEFAGTVAGGNHSIEKVGTATQTFSGSFAGFGGHALRISEGTVALAGTATSIEGGADALNPTSINILSGTTLDVSGTDTTFTSVANEKFIGTGTIVGPFDHAGGDLAPGDVDPSTNPSTGSTPTAGTLAFTGDLTFSGGNIDYDMDLTPAGDQRPGLRDRNDQRLRRWHHLAELPERHPRGRSDLHGPHLQRRLQRLRRRLDR